MNEDSTFLTRGPGEKIVVIVRPNDGTVTMFAEQNGQRMSAMENGLSPVDAIEKYKEVVMAAVLDYGFTVVIAL